MHVHAVAPQASNRQGTVRILRVSLFLTFLYIVTTAIAGVRGNSLALISEAGHNVSDFLALLLSLFAVYLQTRPPSSTKTFGYQRAGVLAAFVNAIFLVALSFYIFYEAAGRLLHPMPVHSGLMMATAAAGVLMNGVIALLLFRSGRDVNIRSAFLHMLGDTLSTSAVIAGGWGIMFTGRYWIDPALSFGIGALILWSSMGIIRETLHILLEGTPRGMQLERVTEAIRGINGVLDVHDLHIWSLGSETHALSCHIRIADIPVSASDLILHEVNDRLRDLFHIYHTTIQLENIVCEVAHGCVISVTEPNLGHRHSH
ncbi:MAG TPA: cation diffusion facilitator family transporter [Terriglobales bacterium]|nr:cation diffusion facilitator family transporter [Terriglobales bacterium]